MLRIARHGTDWRSVGGRSRCDYARRPGKEALDRVTKATSTREDEVVRVDRKGKWEMGKGSGPTAAAHQVADADADNVARNEETRQPTASTLRKQTTIFELCCLCFKRTTINQNACVTGELHYGSIINN
jgi:hypothetical protein